VGRFREALTAMIDGLEISDWSWTDNRGRAYANPPDRDTIAHLALEELMYLYQAKAGQVGVGAEAKNGSTPSA